MVNHRTRRAHVHIIAVAVLLVLIIVVAPVFINSSRTRLAPVVKDASWRVGGQKVTTASVGDEVVAHVVVKATEEYVGSVVVKIRKDVSLWADSDYSVKTVPVDLSADETVDIESPFAPDQASASNLRGYFIEVGFSLTQTSWVMENSYPPRLAVTA